MTRIAILAIAALATALPAAEAALPRASTAKVTILRMKPVVVRGDRFKAGERVRLLLVTNRAFSWGATANSRGVFVSRTRLSLESCTRYSLHAFGSKGSRAMVLPHRSTCDGGTQSGR